MWDEAINGDLSNDRLSTTPVAMAVGSNALLGTVGDSGGGIDRDYFRFTVPPGAVLTSINLLGNTAVSGGASFFAMEDGTQILCTPAGVGLQNLWGFTHYNNGDIGSDILPNLLFLPHTAPLPAGTYSVWVQETGGPATYGFEFVITATGPAASADVPTLPEWAAMLMALVLLTLIWRQRKI